MPDTTPAAPYIARETAVSMGINTALSLAFFLGVFGIGRPVPVWGAGHYVLDFGPQAFMIALMATLVPGAVAARARRAGRVAPVAGPLGLAARLPAGLWPRALLLAAASALGALVLAAAALAATGAVLLPFAPALAAKLAFGAALAAFITPLGLKAVLAP
ncbi:MAG TPA: hypothetical protein VFF94_05205 [Novosphingobium sp.]|nr:hypothetical protein [Novosphingobium sp.]